MNKQSPTLQQINCNRCGKPPENPVRIGARSADVYCMTCTCHECGSTLRLSEESICDGCLDEYFDDTNTNTNTNTGDQS